MTKNSPSIENSLDQLTEAWRIALQEPNATVMLSGFLDMTRDILDASQITRPWHDKDLPPYQDSPYELRGPLFLLRRWRIRFFRLAISALVIALHERGYKPFGRDFWLRDLPEQWRQIIGTSLPTSSMPISPSTRRPSDTPFACRPDYREWMNSKLVTRLATLEHGFQNTLRGISYDPDDQVSYRAYSGVLSIASVILMADKLGLGQEIADNQAQQLILGWLNPAIDDPFKFRFRGDSQLWPDLKYIYVDLGLTPVLGQVLQYDESDMEALYVIRSLPLKEGNTRTVGQDVVHTALRRIDIELAVWCELTGRILENPTDRPPPLNAVTLSADSTSAADNVPAHLRPIIDKLREIDGTLDHPARTSRFAVPEKTVAEEIRTLLDKHEWQLGDDITLIPPDLATPVIEDGIFRINLDWEWMSPTSGWMELRLVALGPGEELAFLDHEDISDEEGDAPVTLRLHGAVWEQMCQRHEQEAIEAMFGRILLARRTSALGTGTIIVGMVNLATI